MPELLRPTIEKYRGQAQELRRLRPCTAGGRIGAGSWHGSWKSSTGGSGWTTAWPGGSAAAPARLERADARPSGGRTRRGTDRWLEDEAMARVKGRRHTWAPGSASRTRPGKG
ncbi:hypothetical protein NKH77_53165 [Streptomyces sp. M19]